MNKLTLRQRATQVLLSILPTKKVTVFSPRAVPLSIAASLDVDTVHEILRGAEAGDVERLFQLYQDILVSDSHLQGRFADRKEAVLGDTLSIQPVDKRNPDDVAAAEAIRAMIDNCQDWEKGCAHLLDSVLWPVSFVEKTFRPSSKPGLRYELSALTPVPYQLLTHIRGFMEIRPTDPATGFPMAATGTQPSPSRYITHRGHLLTAVSDNWGGPMRSLIFWWLLSVMDRDWWARFLDRYGSPFMVGKYDQGDDSSRSILERAFRYSQRVGGLVVSKETEVELKQASASDSGEAYEKFLAICNREKSKLILGETLSSDAQATGMNSGNAEAQSEKRHDKRASDARRLGATLRSQLFEQYLFINGIKGKAPLAIWGSISASELAATGQLIDSLAKGGLRIADDGLDTISERIGLPVERIPAGAQPQMGGGLVPFYSPGLRGGAQHITDVIAERGAKDLAAAFRGDLAPIRAIILEAKTADEAIQGVTAFCAKLDPSRAPRVMESALTAIVANAAAAMGR
jgi:phage gp29-like protein